MTAPTKESPQPANTPASANTNASAPAEAKTRETIALYVTPEFKSHLETYASDRDEGLQKVVRDILAGATKFAGATSPARRTRRKYASVEEREQAMKARAESKRAIMKKLLDKYGGNLEEAAKDLGLA